jgi:tripartite-type tricarboxylate transporter receptor subunit TctC
MTIFEHTHMKALICAAALIALPAAHAQQYPTKPIRVVIPFGPGGPSDIVARTFADRLRVVLNAPVIVDSRPGANTAIGTDIPAKNPDGHTLLVVSMMTAVSLPYLQKTLPYKLSDLMLINRFVTTPMVVAVHPGVPANNLKELIAYAKANPGKLNFGSSGVGQAYHLGAELFAMRTGVQMNHVPYKGSAQTFGDLLGGNIQLAWDAPLAALPHLKTGKLRVLGSTGSKRIAQLPDVPTFMEQGVPNYDLELRWGVFGPNGIPQPLAARLHKETANIAAMPDVKEAVAKLALEPATCASLKACADQLKAESELVGSIIRAVGIKPE